MHKLVVTGLLSPMRLDRYLRSIDSTMTQGFIEKALRSGDIKLSHEKTKASDRVSDGDVITFKDRVHISDKPLHQDFSEASIALSKKLLGVYLIHEHEEFLAINKPAGLPSQGGSKIGISVDHALQYLNAHGHNLRLVHRLDKDTTGVLLLAKNRLAATILTDGFKNHIILKKYIAILNGKVKQDSGQIRSYLAKRHDKIYEVREGDDGSKLAITDYIVTQKNKNLSLVEFTPSTGRMHQIRCHAAFSLKIPVFGDEKYGGNSSESLCLHASEIRLPQEVFGQEYIIKAPCPDRYNKLMK